MPKWGTVVRPAPPTPRATPAADAVEATTPKANNPVKVADNDVLRLLSDKTIIFITLLYRVSNRSAGVLWAL